MNEFEATQLADLHNHLVPGVDDGARTLTESVRHLRAMAGAGVTRLAVSPHLDARAVHESGAVVERMALLRSAFGTLVRACAGHADVPDLVFGQEILVPDPETAKRIFAHEVRVGIDGTRYALVEFGFDLGTDPAGVLHATIDAGRTPIVAHPERYRRDGGVVPLDEVRSWKAAGALLQVNGGSVLGDYGPGIQELALRILAGGLGDLIGTDSHADARPVSPAAVGYALDRRGAGGLARILLSENPQRILADRDTVTAPATPLPAVA